MIESKHTQVENEPKSIADIEPIIEANGRVFSNRNEINRYVEPPLVAPCEHLWDLNIRTLSSSANANNIGGVAQITIAFESLSEANKAVALRIGRLIEKKESKQSVILEVPITPNTAIEEIEEKFKEMVGYFQRQRARWIQSYTLQELNKMYTGDPDISVGVEGYTQQGYYYDPSSQKFYESEELFRKAQEKVD